MVVRVLIGPPKPVVLCFVIRSSHILFCRFGSAHLRVSRSPAYQRVLGLVESTRRDISGYCRAHQLISELVLITRPTISLLHIGR